MTDVPRYRVVQRCYLQPHGYAIPVLLEIGAEVEFQGTPGMGLMPLNAPARASKAASIKTMVLDRGADLMTQRRRMARSLGFAGNDSAAAREHIAQFINKHSS